MAYIIKVTIENTHPPIWRRILIPEKISFRALHEILQMVFGWDDFHIHDFTFPIRDIEIVQKGETAYGKSALEDNTAIDDFLPYCKWIRYTYDFGDDWRHKIVLEKTDMDYDSRHAVVLKAKGDNFKEDCGGVWCDEEDNRSPFCIDEVNAALKEWEIPRIKSSKQAVRLSEELQLGERLKENQKEFEKYVRQIAEEILNSHKVGVKEMWENQIEHFFHDTEDENRSKRAQMADKLMYYVNDRMFDMVSADVSLCVNFHEPVRNVRDMLADLSGTELSDYCEYMQLGCEREGTEQYIEAIWKAYTQHPEYLLYVFTEEEFVLLKKLLEIPDGRSYEIKEIDLLFKGISLGIIDIEIPETAQNGVVNLRFATDVAELLQSMTDSEVREWYKKLVIVYERMESLLMTYSMIEMETFKETCLRNFSKKIDDKEFLRYVYWHMYFLNEVQIVDKDTERYLAVPQLDVDAVLLAMREYGVTVPYRKFQEKQMLSHSRGYREVYPIWKDFEDFLSENYELDEGEVAFWSSEEYKLVQDGASATELYLDMKENFEFSSVISRTECWSLFTELCLYTPIPALKGYSRLEYFKLTGREPWESGLYDTDCLNGISEEDGLYGIDVRQQYELYCITVKEKNSASDVRAIKKIAGDMPCEMSDLKFMLALAYLKNDELKRAERLLQELYHETKDEAIEELLAMLYEAKQEVAAEYGWGNFFTADAPVADVIPFKREREKIGRNAPCPCGSGKKFKQCCLGKGIYD